MDRDLGVNRLYIIELQRAHLLSLAQMLHVGIALDPKNDIINNTLEQLVLQGDGIHRAAEKHKVFTRENAPPKAEIVKEGVYYIPYKYPTCN